MSRRCDPTRSGLRVRRRSVVLAWQGVVLYHAPLFRCCSVLVSVPATFVGDSPCVWRPRQVTSQLAAVRASGISSVAVVLMHAYTFPDHERQVLAIAKALGFTQISLSSEVMPMVRRVKAVSSTRGVWIVARLPGG